MGLFSCSCENDPYGKAMDLFPESSYPTFSFANGARRMVAPSGRVYSLHSSWSTYVGYKYPLECCLKDESCDSLDSFFRQVRTFDLVRVFPFSRYQELTLPEIDALRYFCIQTADGDYARCFSVMQHELQRGMKALWGDNIPTLIKDEYDNNLRIVRGLIAKHATPAGDM